MTSSWTVQSGASSAVRACAMGGEINHEVWQACVDISERLLYYTAIQHPSRKMLLEIWLLAFDTKEKTHGENHSKNLQRL